MKINSEAEMLEFGKNIAKTIKLPMIIELTGDVGAGKTTFTRGLAEGLGISTPVTSPSFTISKRYAFNYNNQPATLVHYDFYRLPDPGIMSEELIEALSEPNTLVVIEWSDSVADFLPEDRLKINIALNPDGTRTIS